MQKNKRKLIARISSIVVACASALILCISPFMPKIQPKNMIASADVSTSNYVFNGSLVLCPVSHSIGSPESWLGGVRISNLTATTYYIQFLTSYGSLYDVGGGDFSGVTPNLDIWSAFHLYGYDANYYNVLIRRGSSFDANVVGVTLSMINSSSWVDQLGEHNGNNSITVFRYFGTGDENWIEFGFPSFISNFYYGYSTFDTRTYYFVQENSEGYEAGYQSGYSVGKTDGIEQGYVQGYEKAETQAYKEGYNLGYQDGVNGANEYSFFNLISAVIDAPVQAFMGLFNFELLGVNLAGFFTGLLTLAFILTVVKLLL